MKPSIRILATTFGLACAVSALATADGGSVPFPSDYREWTHVKSMLIEEGHSLFAAFGGIHHLYANDEAIEGYATGKFPDGAVIVFDLLEMVEADNAVVEGGRKVLGVMHKDSARYATTGGWGFEGFGGGDPDNRVVGDDAATACFQCHTSQADRGYVFSSWRD